MDQGRDRIKPVPCHTHPEGSGPSEWGGLCQWGCEVSSATDHLEQVESHTVSTAGGCVPWGCVNYHSGWGSLHVGNHLACSHTVCFIELR